ncbi:MAG: type II toxin-antitoxin system death-on-curing family toxin [Bacilli bacterium]
MIKLTKARVLLLYQMMVKQTGGAYGIRDEKMLESAIEAPFQTFDGQDLFPSKIEKAARLGCGLIANHPFIDGNKRIGFYIMMIFLEVNGICLSFDHEEIERLALGIAAGEIRYEDLLRVLEEKNSK